MNQDSLKETVLMHVQESILYVAEVEGEIDNVVKQAGRIIIKFKNGNSYSISLMNKETIKATLD